LMDDIDGYWPAYDLCLENGWATIIYVTYPRWIIVGMSRGNNFSTLNGSSLSNRSTVGPSSGYGRHDRAGSGPAICSASGGQRRTNT
jgi:hypothetical protein